MEKWARNLQLIINKRDALLIQLNKITGNNYSYLSLQNLTINHIKGADAKIIFSQLQNAIGEYNDALLERDEKMFGKFLDSLIHDKSPTKESQNWCAYKY
ncbi:hypothetical protein [Saccharicrinis fermentans]|uniref:Uncharacterized protein n=1 Tax=Saccharicrinis fermentans DSM 9555 = JCM 21142 TaxID=869213 RepID=W7YJY7_9BACT|nr:hypothetical protein [Saccharicrinis fermentans]GAF04851.1 hypothetical protein JCM21142_93571 [Saccharicrinis fermentans DSM 9555 = JCM 21142]